MFDSFELVLEDRFGIIKQPSNKRGFAVVDGTGGGEAEKVHGEKDEG